MHYLKVNYFGICATSHVAMPKNTNCSYRQNKKSFFFGFRQIFRSIVQNSNHCTKYEAWYTQNGIGGGYTIFLLFILYILKFLETGADWNFTRLGVYPMEQRGVFGILRTSTGTQQFQASVRQYDSTLFPDVVSVLFLPAYSPLHLLCHLDRMRCAYLSYKMG